MKLISTQQSIHKEIVNLLAHIKKEQKVFRVQLAYIAENKNYKLAECLVAGQFLGEIEDIKINPSDPLMIDVPVAQIEMDRLQEKLNKALSCYKAKGFQYDWLLKEAPNMLEEGIYSSTPVGIFPKSASPFGLLDMGGNVQEYVDDFLRTLSY